MNDAANSSAPHNEQKKRDPIEQRPDTAGIADELDKLAEEVRESQGKDGANPRDHTVYGIVLWSWLEG